jgi:hypothetical protein
MRQSGSPKNALFPDHFLPLVPPRESLATNKQTNMARPKLHSDITPNRLLVAIVGQYRATLHQIAQERSAAQTRVEAKESDYGPASGTVYQLDRYRQRLKTDGLRYDLPAWLGEQPTASRRILAQRCVRELEAAGLVECLGEHARFVRPTDAGLAAVPEVANA